MIIGIDVRHLTRGPETGIATITYALVEALARKAPEDHIRIFYNGGHAPPDRVLSWPKRFSNLALSVWRMPNRLFDVTGRFFRFPNVDAILGGVDVFFSPHALITPLAQCPRVLVVHDLSFVRDASFFSPASRRWHWFMDVRSQARSASAVVVPSRATARDLQYFWNIPSDRIHVIPWGGTVSGAHPTDAVRVSAGAIRPPFILFVGAVDVRKNVSGLIEAFSLLVQNEAFPDYTLVIAGPDGWRAEETRMDVARFSLQRRVVFLGFVSEEEKADLFSRASLFVYPSFYEGFGLPVLEAMVAGVPVVASATGAISEVAGDAAFLVDARRPQDIALAMRAVLTDEKLTQELSARGKQRSAVFTWESTAATLLALLRESVRGTTTHKGAV